MKTNVILDTDISNEIDDQFALCYLVKSLQNINLQAVTIAPFSQSIFAQTSTTAEGTELSYNTACKIFDLLSTPQYKSLVTKGATQYYWQSTQLNPASQRIIDLARQNDSTTVIAIGAITNLAVALHHAPDIAPKMNIVWLGGHSFLTGKNDEYNFRQDIDAVRKVFNSLSDVVVIPCKNVAAQLSTTIFELQHYIQGSDIGNYLCEIFANCGSSYYKTPQDKIGQAKVLWDISAVAYVVNPAWFDVQTIPTPTIADDTSYQFTENAKTITFVSNLSRHAIYKDFFLKMQ